MAADVRQWLESLGLGKYGDVFAENGVDVDIIADLDKARLSRLRFLDPTCNWRPREV